MAPFLFPVYLCTSIRKYLFLINIPYELLKTHFHDQKLIEQMYIMKYLQIALRKQLFENYFYIFYTYTFSKKSVKIFSKYKNCSRSNKLMQETN